MNKVSQEIKHMKEIFAQVARERKEYELRLAQKLNRQVYDVKMGRANTCYDRSQPC